LHRRDFLAKVIGPKTPNTDRQREIHVVNPTIHGMGLRPSPIGAMICGVVAYGAPARASTPVLAWDGARRLGVQCLVDPDRLPDRRRLQAALCDRVRTLAADKAPIPVVLLAPGDPGLIAADTAVLLFHANVQPGAGPKGGPLLVFSLRAFRATAAPSELFGAAPRATALPDRPAAPSPVRRGPERRPRRNPAVAITAGSLTARGMTSTPETGRTDAPSRRKPGSGSPSRNQLPGVPGTDRRGRPAAGRLGRAGRTPRSTARAARSAASRCSRSSR
jgi:hypothetical protein